MDIPNEIAKEITIREYASVRFAIQSLLELKQTMDFREDLEILSTHIDQIFTVMKLVQFVVNENTEIAEAFSDA